MIIYALAPFIAWLIAGSLKFIVNYLRYNNQAVGLIGNGGFPSNHTTIMTTTIMLIGFKEGFNTSVFGLGVAISFIVIIDATGLRRHVGYHAKSINEIVEQQPNITVTKKNHRESMGHKRVEVIGGLLLGIALGWILYHFSKL